MTQDRIVKSAIFEGLDIIAVTDRKEIKNATAATKAGEKRRLSLLHFRFGELSMNEIKSKKWLKGDGNKRPSKRARENHLAILSKP